MSKKSRVVAIVNQKGGVGKTTTTINLAAALALRGRRVLLIDMDPQGNASTGLGVSKISHGISLYDVLVDGEALSAARVDTSIEGLSLIPSHIDLAAVEQDLSDRPDRTTCLRRALDADARAGAQYDYVLIDCPPSLNLLTINALSASGSVLVPLQCEFFALEGLSQLLKTVEMAKESINPNLKVDGVMLTMYDARNRLSVQVVEDVRKHLGRAVFKTVIPRNVRIAEAPSFGQSVLTYDANCAGAIAYRALADEVLSRHARRK